MSQPKIIDLGTVDIGAGGSTTPKRICHQYAWSIAPTVVGTPGQAAYSLMVSQDNITFFDYKIASTNVPIQDAIMDQCLNWSWVRIDVVAGGPSAGTAQFGLELKG